MSKKIIFSLFCCINRWTLQWWGNRRDYVSSFRWPRKHRLQGVYTTHGSWRGPS